MDPEISRIVRMIEKTFDKSPWYGTSIMGSLSEISPAQASHRAGQNHSINELTLHMVSWRTFAVRRLRGDNTFEISDELNFPLGSDWAEALKKLRQSQEELVAAAKDFPDSRLGELVPSKTQKYTYYTLLHGIVQHDIYHLGQIQLIRKSLAGT